MRRSAAISTLASYELAERVGAESSWPENGLALKMLLTWVRSILQCSDILRCTSRGP